MSVIIMESKKLLFYINWYHEKDSATIEGKPDDVRCTISRNVVVSKCSRIMPAIMRNYITQACCMVMWYL